MTHLCVMHDTGNLLGAMALAAMDAVGTATAGAVGHGGETAAALVAIGHVPGLSNLELCQVLGLSHPGTVRLVDRLAIAGLVERREAADRRAVSLHLTRAGRTRRQAVLAARAAALDVLLEPLNEAERATLGALLARVLRAQPRDWVSGLAICRLCDEGRCADCPVDAAIADAAD